MHAVLVEACADVSLVGISLVSECTNLFPSKKSGHMISNWKNKESQGRIKITYPPKFTGTYKVSTGRAAWRDKDSIQVRPASVLTVCRNRYRYCTVAH